MHSLKVLSSKTVTPRIFLPIIGFTALYTLIVIAQPRGSWDLTMASVDVAVAAFFNELVQRSWTFDSVMVFLSSSNISKGYLSLPLIWWAWFAYRHDDYKRAIIGTVLVSCLVAVAISQLSQYYPSVCGLCSLPNCI